MSSMKDLEDGYCLSPREVELAEYYLWRKNHNTPDTDGKWIIPEFNIHSVEPKQLIPVFNALSLINSNGEECFFFHKPVIDHVRNRVSRKVAGDEGYWKQTGDGRQPQDTDKYKWSKHIFSYQPKQESSEHTCWVMHEFRLEDYPSYVLCRITKKLKRKPKRSNLTDNITKKANSHTRPSQNDNHTPLEAANSEALIHVNDREVPTITTPFSGINMLDDNMDEFVRNLLEHEPQSPWSYDLRSSHYNLHSDMSPSVRTGPSQNDNHTPLAASSKTLVHANALEVPTIMTTLDGPSPFQKGDHEFQTLCDDYLKSCCDNLDNFHVDMSPSESTIEAHAEPLDICVADYGIC